jgi:hypothetical protein
VSRPLCVLAGIVGRFPVGGVTWCALHYIAGLQRLGWDVFYLEDTGECPYDPVANGITTDPSYAVGYIRRQLARVGLEHSFSYVDHRGRRWHGAPRARVAEACRSADLLINLSGGIWRDRPEYDQLPKIFVDTDPGFTQQTIADTGPGRYRDFVASHVAHFTFATNVDGADCGLAATPFAWQPTVQPLALDFWPVLPVPDDAPFSTVMSWRIDSFPGTGKGKAAELLRLRGLPARTGRRLRLAVAGHAPYELLEQSGWEVRDAVEETIDPDAYRTFIQSSRAELGLAKAMYIETRSGWFSDRTQCYLASGRPALVRDTGFSTAVPVGEGLLTFSDEEGVLAGIEEIDRDYDRHAHAARELAAEHFEATAVVRDLLERANVAVAA